MSNDISGGKCYQDVCGHSNGHKAPSPYTTPQALFLLGLRLLTSEQRNQFWQYLVLTDYGTRYIPPEKQAQLLKLLAQLAEEEKLCNYSATKRGGRRGEPTMAERKAVKR